MTELQKLQARLDKLKEQGLVNIRFTLSPEPGITVEEVCAEINAMLDAREEGRSEPLVFNDKWPEPAKN